ncbi:MAG: hypothetical protein RL583_1093, partial [Actinomycetota bacterium]
GAFGGQSLPELSVLAQQGKGLPERGICNDVRNKRGLGVWPGGDFYPTFRAASILAVVSRGAAIAHKSRPRTTPNK